MEREQQVADAINRCNLSGAVEDRGEWQSLVNDYFCFDEDPPEIEPEPTLEEETIIEEEPSEPESDEDEPLVIPDPTEQILAEEKARCQNFV